MKLEEIPSIRMTPRQHRLLGECVEKYRRAYRFGKRRVGKAWIGQYDSCALCCAYFEDMCRCCPIMIATGQMECYATPYRHEVKDNYAGSSIPTADRVGSQVTAKQYRKWAKDEYLWLKRLYDLARVGK